MTAFAGSKVAIVNPATGVPYDSTSPLSVLSSGGYVFRAGVTPTVTNGAYSAGDIVGALMTFTVSRANDEGVILDRVSIKIKAAVSPSLTLVLFDADPTGTTKTDNAAYSLAAADTFKEIVSLPINALGGYMVDHGTPKTFHLGNLDCPITPVSGGKDVYGLLIANTGVTLTSTGDVRVTLSGRGA